MKLLSKKLKNNEKGFTLIELIIVIAIIGILAAVLVPRFGGFTDRADIAACRSEARNIQTAALAYFAENPDGTITESRINSYLGTDYDTTSDASISTSTPNGTILVTENDEDFSISLRQNGHTATIEPDDIDVSAD